MTSSIASSTIDTGSFHVEVVVIFPSGTGIIVSPLTIVLDLG